MKRALSNIRLDFNWTRIRAFRGIRVPSRSEFPSLPTAIITLEMVEFPVEPEKPEQAKVETPAPQPLVEKPREVPVKVIPPRQKRKPRAPKAVEPPPPPPEPKSLKVIRRRKEQAPKVFETPPKEFPDIILSGFHIAPEDDVAK